LESNRYSEGNNKRAVPIRRQIMKKLIMIWVFITICISFITVEGRAFTTLSECLITKDIGIYSFDTESTNIGKGSGVVGLAGHFDLNHEDSVCTGEYSNINEIRGMPIEEARQKIIGVEVQVTQHAGSDSDKWLLHEVESSFRGREKEGWLGQGLRGSASVREINGNKIFDYGNIDYRWVSNNVVVYIHYTDLEGTKPEPLEIVQAYLRKFPSTITLTETEIKSKAHNEQWIKDEMERRLWLCDKWFMALQLQKTELDKVLRESVEHMNVFLDYREKYYGIKASTEKQLLWKYLQAKDGTAIKNKLTEYKTWWNENKDKPINL
jgi:hypothetical protein